jgi:glycerophosphoryl diester phosphodiesterase
MPYPRVCAHRGFSAVAPENSMAAFGAAVAMGADEIELDLWYTKDREIVSIHDGIIDHVSNGSGTVTEMTYEELLEYDFGVKSGESFRGMKIIKLEEILKKLGCQTVMNIHIKTHDETGKYDSDIFDKIVKLIDKYDCRKHVYFMSCCDDFLRQALEKCPDIARCRGMRGLSLEATREMIDSAVKYKCSKVQFFKPYYNDEFIKEAHEKGLICNVFWSDDPLEAKEMIGSGFDTVLTNEFNLVNNIIKG